MACYEKGFHLLLSDVYIAYSVNWGGLETIVNSS